MRSSARESREALRRLLQERERAERSDYPATAGQRALWLHQQLYPASAAYNLRFAARVTGGLDPRRLFSAMSDSVRRHPALRSRFKIADDVLTVHVVDEETIDSTHVDGHDWNDSDIRDHLRRCATRAFDLEAGPLVRVATVGRGGELFVMVAVHHIVADMWSLGLFVDETLRNLGGSTEPVPTRTIDFSRHARDEDRWINTESADRSRDYWRERLSGDPEPVTLSGRTAPAAGPRPVRYVRFDLDAELSDRIRAMGRHRSATAFSVLLASAKVVFRHRTGLGRFVFGSVSSGRESIGSHGTVGYFANPFPVVADLSDAQSFSGLLDETQTGLAEDLAHVRLPHFDLSSSVVGQGDQLIRTSVVLESVPRSGASFLPFSHGGNGSSLKAGSYSLEPFDLVEAVSELELVWFVEYDGRQFRCSLQYDMNVFSESLVERIGQELTSMLRRVCLDPDARISDLWLLTDEEQCSELTPTMRVDFDGELFPDAIDRWAVERPEQIALVGDEASLTYAELSDRVRSAARLLAALGLRPQSRIGVHLDGRVDSVVATLAVLRAGHTFVPLDPSYPGSRISYIVDDAGVELFVGRDIDVSQLPGIETLDPAALLTIGDEARLPTVRGEDAAYVCYTSGSTGHPKGVIVEHRNLAYLAHGITMLYERLDEDHFGAPRRVLQFSAPAFDAAIWELTSGLALGNTLVVAPRVQRLPGEPLIDIVRRFGVTSMMMPPSALANVDPETVPTLVEVLSAGEALTRAVINRWAIPGRTLLNAYGPTECTVVASVSGPVSPGAPVSIGDVFDGAQFLVLDERQRPVPTGVVGELYIAGHGVARGYQGRSDETTARFLPHPLDRRIRMYASGDRVVRTASGELEYRGRADDQVKIRGFRVEPDEVAHALLSLQGVGRAFVVPKDAGTDHAQLLGFVVPDRGLVLRGDDLRRELEVILPAYLLPNTIYIVDEVPVTANGKVDRRALLALAEASPDRLVDVPETSTELMIAGVWSDVLGVDGVGRGDDFFALGGNSLLALQVRGRLTVLSGVELPVDVFFESSCLRDLAAAVDAAVPPGTDQHGSESWATDDRLSFSQQRLWFLNQLDPTDRSYNLIAGLRLVGPVDIDTLVDACAQAVYRHESLRTVFELGAEGPRRVVRPPGDHVDVPVYRAGRENDVIERLETPFDLGREVVRFGLLIEKPDCCTLYVAAHHIVIDGVGISSLFADIGRIYSARRRDEEPPPPVGDPYSAYVAWQRNLIESSSLEEKIDIWADSLRTSSSALNLPRRKAGPGDSGIVHHLCAEGLERAVRSKATSSGATMPVMALTAFQIVLSRWSGANDFSIGVPLVGRSAERFEQTVGMFVNALPLPTVTGVARTVSEAVALTRERLVRALADQDVPFELLVERVAPQRDTKRPPLFQVMFNYLDIEREVDFEGLSVAAQRPLATGAKYDLTLYCYVEGERLKMTAVYDTDRFDRDLAGDFLRSVEEVLEALTGPDAPLSEVGTQGWSDPRRLARTSPNVDPLERLEAIATTDPSREAICGADSVVTYSDLAERVLRLSSAFSERLDVGQPVLLLAGRCVETVVAILAAFHAGIEVAVIDASQPEAWLRSAAAAASCSTVVDASRSSSPTGFSDVLLGVVSECGLLVTNRYDLDRQEPLEVPEPAGRPSRKLVCSSSAAYVLFTSGTGGTPCAVRTGLDPVMHYLGWASEYFSLSSKDRTGFIGGTGHDPMLRDILCPLVVGGTCVIPSAEVLIDPGMFADWLSRERVTVLHMTPSRSRILTRGTPAPLPELRLIVFCGERLDSEHVAAVRVFAPEARIVNGYGATETPQLAACWEIGPDAVDPIPIGRGIDGTELVVVRDGRPARPHEYGEILVRSRNLADRIVGDDEADRTRFSPDPAGIPGVRAYHTADAGRFLPDGTVLCLGRLDRGISIRGNRVDPREVEHALMTCAGVRDAVVVPGDWIGASLADTLVGYVVCDEPFDAVEIRRQMGEIVPRHLVPGYLERLSAIPLTSNGKVDVERLPAPERRQRSRRSPTTSMQGAVAQLWDELLAIEVADVHTGFFEAGGHSLQLIDLQQRIRERFAVDIGIVDLFQANTIAAQAEFIEGKTATSAPPVVNRAIRRAEKRRNRHAPGPRRF